MLGYQFSKNYDLLESEGRWDELDKILKVRPPSSPEEKILALKTEVYVHGPSSQLTRKINAIEFSEISPLAKLRLLLLRAYLSRRARKTEESEQELVRAQAHLKRSKLRHPLADELTFQRGMNFLERNDLYQALLIFSDLRSKTKSRYRQGMCALNECTILWDLGLAQKIQELLPLVPAEFKFRIKIGIDLAAGRFGRVKRWLEKALKKDSREYLAFLKLPSSERENALLHLVEWLLLEEQGLQIQHLQEIFHSDFAASPVLCEAFLEGNHSAQKSAPDECDVMILQFLKSGKRGLAAYKKEIEPILKKQELFGPLLPRTHEIASAATPYAELWNRYLNATTATPDMRILLENTGQAKILRPRQAPRILDLRRQPVARKLLTAMTGTIGSRFSRKTIHEQLTRSRYSPALHDARLHKLLSRVGDRITALSGQRPWEQPGDRTLVLLASIENAPENLA